MNRLRAVTDSPGDQSSAIAACMSAFDDTRDSQFFFSGSSSASVLKALEEFAIAGNNGIGMVTAGPGCGKSMLRTRLYRQLAERNVDCVMLENALLDFDGLLLEIISQLEGRRIWPNEYADRYSRLAALKQSLLRRTVSTGGKLILLVDEAQQLDQAALEGVRAITNIASERQNYVTPLLFGQPELASRLGRTPEFASRLAYSGRLGPLSVDETGDYIRHRIKVATGLAAFPFTADAVERLHALSAGIPRNLNRQCKMGLQICLQQKKNAVSASLLPKSRENSPSAPDWHDSCLIPG